MKKEMVDVKTYSWVIGFADVGVSDVTNIPIIIKHPDYYNENIDETNDLDKFISMACFRAIDLALPPTTPDVFKQALHNELRTTMQEIIETYQIPKEKKGDIE